MAGRPAAPGVAVPGAAPAWLRPHAIAYVAAVPTDALAPLACPRSWAAVGRMLDLERACDGERDRVSELLYRAVAAAPDRDRRRALLRLRRELHRSRVAPDARALCQQAPLPAEERAVLLAQCDRLAAIEELERCLDRTLDEELAQAAGVLPAIAADHEPVVAGIALVSPDLYRDVSRRLEARRAEPERGARPDAAELSLTLYLLRAVTKIATYSSFTSVAPARWEEAGPALRIVGGGLRQRRVVVPNHLPPTVIRLALASRSELPTALNPYCSLLDGEIRTVRQRDLDVAVRRCVHRTVELVSVRCHEALRDALGTGRPIPAGVTRTLLDLQVLVPAAGPSREDPADELLAMLDTAPAAAWTDAREVAAGVREVRRLASECGGMAAPDRAAAVERIEDLVRGALRAAGVQPTPVLTEPAVYERAELAEAEVAISRTAWEPVLRDLRTLEAVMPLWDLYEPLRALAVRHFVERFGAGGTCGDVLQFLLAGHQQEESGLSPDAIGLSELDWWLRFVGDGGTSERDRLRRRRRTELLSGLRRAVERDAVEVDLDPGWLDELGAGLGAAVWTPVQCHAHHGHLCADGSLVLNTITDGWGRRLAASGLVRAAGEGGEELVPAAPAGHELVELSGAFGFNANAHPPLTARRLLLPGDGGLGDGGPGVRLTDLELTHDAVADRLRLVHRRDGVEIHPLYLGTLTPWLLGPLHRALLPFTQASRTEFPVAELVHRTLERPDQVGRYPRVRLGRVVLSRRKWIVPGHLWPEWPPAHAMGATFLRDLERWRRALGLPERVYVRPVGAADGSLRYWKPQYVDFRSAFLLAAVSRRMRIDSRWVVIEEALPAPEEHAARWEDARYASMVVIETRVGGA